MTKNRSEETAAELDLGQRVASGRRRARVWANKAVSVMCAVTLVCGLVPNVALGSDRAAGQEAQAVTATATATDDAQATVTQTTAGQAGDSQAAQTKATEPAKSDAQATDAAKKDDAEKSVAYPAVTFPTQHANGVAVDVSAPEGALPEGATLKVTGVSSEDVRGTVADAVSEDVSASEIAAVDISFTYTDPKTGQESEVEPKSDISVKLAADSIRDARSNAESKVDVVHIADTGSAEVVPSSSTADDQVQISSKDFSVYAIVTQVTPRLTVRFENGAAEAPSMIVKADDTADEVAQIVHDPGVEGLAPNEVFTGWTTDPNYTADTQLLTIEQVREAAMAKADQITSDETVTYYKATAKRYKVNYVDEKGVSQGTETVEVPGNSATGEGTYTVNMGYTPDSSERAFEGWLVAEGKSNVVGYEEGHLYKNGDSVTIKGDVEFRVSEPYGRWLVFEENGKGATYNAPQFVKSGETTSKPCDDSAMVRYGYTFGGWYSNKECTGAQFEFGKQLNEAKTVYAKWIPNTNANYTVIIWKQNLEGDGYDFEEAVNLSGRVGTTVNTVSKQGDGDSAYASVNGTNKQYTGFHLKDFDQNVTIATEGNSIVNVYYNRNEITLNFNVYEYAYVPTSSNRGTQYGLVNGEYVDLYRSGGTWYYGYWERYSGQRYTYELGWHEYKTMKGLYGQGLSEEGFEWPTEYNWYDGHNNQGEGTGTRTTFLDAFLPSDGSSTVDYYGEEPPSDQNNTINFFKQKSDGDGYELANTVTTTAGSFYISDKYNGFTADHYSVDFGADVNVGTKASNGYYNGGKSVSYNDRLDVYFDRSSYKLNYMDGLCVDGNGNTLDETNLGQLRDADTFAYGADVSSHNKGAADYFQPTREGFAFEGWYSDPECTHPYTFTTMPDGGITVYAKWRQVQYRVFLHPNAGTQQSDPSLDWGSASQDMNFRVSHGGTISLPNTALRDGYDFVGWYSDAACTKVFNSDTRLTDAMASPYNKATDYTDVMDQWGNISSAETASNSDATGFNGGDRFWITKRVDVYAKWRSVLIGADGINVLYDENVAEGGKEGSKPTDTSFYADSANVTAGAAAQPADSSKKYFKHWVVQHWNKDTQAYEDTSTTVQPGGTFEISQSDARVVEREGSTPENPLNTYTVRLKAVWGDVEQRTPTHIDWYANYGTENDGKGQLYHSDQDVKINDGVDIVAAPSREGYTFVGWTKTKGGTKADFLSWDGEKYTTTVDGETHVVTQVAADEKQPYDDLYAVWRANLTVRIVGNTNTVTYNAQEQSVSGYTVTYKVADQAETSVAPSGVSVTLKQGKEAIAKGTNASDEKYMMGLTLADFEVSAADYNYDASDAANSYTDGWLKITKKAVTVKADDKTKTFGDADPELTAKVEGADAGQINFTLGR
ncbi:InlB B-repeat-containing protein, partial [Olsenella intestinalis]|uniref:InlB B-repeat-containing protein n=1 Tax=Olsenella intestinalis TaxID=2930083 RepID=UPI00200FE4D5